MKNYTKTELSAITENIFKKINMPVYLLHTDQELLKIRKSILRKIDLTKEDLILLGEINDYCKTKK